MRVEVVTLQAARRTPHARDFYSYRVNPSLADAVRPGSLVSVPFGERGTPGIVWSLDASDDASEDIHDAERDAERDDAPPSGVLRLREISALLAPEPLLSESQRSLAEWIAAYYWAPLGAVARMFLPPGLVSSARSALRPTDDALAGDAETLAATLEPDAALAFALLREEGVVETERLVEALGARQARAVIRALVERRLARLTTELPATALRPRRERMARLSAPPAQVEAWRAETRAKLDALVAAQPVASPTSRRRRSLAWAAAPRPTDHESERLLRQLAAVDVLERAAAPWRVEELLRLTRATPTGFAELERAGLVVVEHAEARHDPLAGRTIEPTTALPLTPTQRSALDAILDPEGPVDDVGAQVCLLHGVTGSGKTEVYLQALAAVIARGRRGLALVPEIALTPQAMARYAGRFPGRVALLHSDLTPAERLSEWRRIRAGEVDIVLGSRSALFAPITDLGLIILDEEHEAAYKQERTPSYHARDVATRLAAQTGATLVLGSATPSMESFERARSGVWRLVEMHERVGPAAEATPRFPQVAQGEDASSAPATSAGAGVVAPGLPPVTIVDLRAELRDGNTSILSETLRTALTETLARGEQAILFLNRRGFATSVICRECGYVARCPHCDVALTFHAGEKALICHYCGKREAAPRQCPICWSASIRYFGLGAERVETTLKRMFPAARTLRWDRDTARTRQAHEDLLRAFSERRADLLVGTQMIAKGLDLPAVTLVGVVSADVALTLPDFRASERAFQLLTQVAGRAGRGAAPGRVIVQTFNPEHFCIRAAAQHDYETFSEVELSVRRQYGYPPFRRLVKLVYEHHDRYSAQVEAMALADALERVIQARRLPATDLVGPAPAFMERLRGRYRWQIILRGPDPLQALRALPPDALVPGWAIDVDPATSL
ncbi:MAG TPA: primosomal protein N' [Ktedonobacterales bacterium]|nr:primosomal protein N' [Ktedonobacterales bacterium]